MASEPLVLPDREWTPEYAWLFNKQTGEHDRSFYLTDAQEVVLHDRHRFKVVVARNRPVPDSDRVRQHHYSFDLRGRNAAKTSTIGI